MSDFDTLLDEYLGQSDDVTDIQAVVRRLWFYDFDGYPIYLWQGQGKLITTDGIKWFGTIGGNGVDYHKTPSISDGRDGSSATYNFSIPLIDIPGQTALQAYDALKEEQWRVFGRTLKCYLAIFQPNEGLRPTTPKAFFKELNMMAPKFSEKIEISSSNELTKKYYLSVTAKDGNFGRSQVPNGTYADTQQKQHAKDLGVTLDRGSEFLAKLANRTIQLQ